MEGTATKRITLRKTVRNSTDHRLETRRLRNRLLVLPVGVGLKVVGMAWPSVRQIVLDLCRNGEGRRWRTKLGDDSSTTVTRTA